MTVIIILDKNIFVQVIALLKKSVKDFQLKNTYIKYFL